MYETFILGGLILALIWWISQPSARLKKFGDAIPGPRAYPIVGNMFNVPLTGPKSLISHRELAVRYKGTYRLYFPQLLIIMISSPEDIEAVLSNNELITKSSPYQFLKSWLGSGLLISTGEKWHSRRKIITPTFHFKILEEFLSVFNSHSSFLIEQLENECGKESFDVELMIKKCTLNILCETAMGTTAESNFNTGYIQAVGRICEILSNRINKPWLYSNFMYILSGGYFKERNVLKSLKSYTDKLIESKKCNVISDDSDEEDDFGIKKKKGFLEQLLKIRAQSNSSFSSDDDVMDEVNTFLFAGHDTSTSTICFILHLLAENSEVQEALFQELYTRFQSKNVDITREDLNEMKYLERVIKESLRMYPTVPFIGRAVTKDTKLPSGYILPKDATALINIYHNHRNENQYKNPDQFNPDNFLPEEVAKRHPFSFIPFSAGSRNCIGQKFALMEVKTILTKIVLNYKVEPVGGDYQLAPDPKMVLHSATGHKLKISKRL